MHEQTDNVKLKFIDLPVSVSDSYTNHNSQIPVFIPTSSINLNKNKYRSFGRIYYPCIKSWERF